MKRIAGYALAFMLAARAQAQDLPLTPLVPAPPPSNAPWLKKNQKPPEKKPEAKKTKKKKPASPQAVESKPGSPAVASPPPAEPPLALPPLEPAKPVEAQKPPPAETLPLPPLVPLAPPMVSSIAVLAQGESAAQVKEGLEGVLKIAPLTRAAPAVTPPGQPCDDDACLASIGASAKVDQLLVANYAHGTLQVKLVGVATKKTISQAEQDAVAPDLARPWAERLGCRLLVPAGCPASLGKIEEKRPVPAAAVAAAPSPSPAPRNNWKKPASLAALGLGAAAAATGLYFGAKSHSQINDAESSFKLHNGAYTAADVDTLNSGNNAAKTANILFAVSGALLATSALIAFAF